MGCICSKEAAAESKATGGKASPSAASPPPAADHPGKDATKHSVTDVKAQGEVGTKDVTETKASDKQNGVPVAAMDAAKPSSSPTGVVEAPQATPTTATEQPRTAGEGAQGAGLGADKEEELQEGVVSDVKKSELSSPAEQHAEPAASAAISASAAAQAPPSQPSDQRDSTTKKAVGSAALHAAALSADFATAPTTPLGDNTVTPTPTDTAEAAASATATVAASASSAAKATGGVCEIAVADALSSARDVPAGASDGSTAASGVTDGTAAASGAVSAAPGTCTSAVADALAQESTRRVDPAGVVAATAPAAPSAAPAAEAASSAAAASAIGQGPEEGVASQVEAAALETRGLPAEPAPVSAAADVAGVSAEAPGTAAAAYDAPSGPTAVSAVVAAATTASAAPEAPTSTSQQDDKPAADVSTSQPAGHPAKTRTSVAMTETAAADAVPSAPGAYAVSTATEADRAAAAAEEPAVKAASSSEQAPSAEPGIKAAETAVTASSESAPQRADVIATLSSATGDGVEEPATSAAPSDAAPKGTQAATPSGPAQPDAATAAPVAAASSTGPEASEPASLHVDVALEPALSSAPHTPSPQMSPRGPCESAVADALAAASAGPADPSSEATAPAGATSSVAATTTDAAAAETDVSAPAAVSRSTSGNCSSTLRQGSCLNAVADALGIATTGDEASATAAAAPQTSEAATAGKPSGKRGAVVTAAEAAADERSRSPDRLSPRDWELSPREVANAHLHAACVEVLSAKATTADGVRSARAIARMSSQGSGSVGGMGASAVASGGPERVPSLKGASAKPAPATEEAPFTTADASPDAAGAATSAATLTSTLATTSANGVSAATSATNISSTAAKPQPPPWQKSGMSFAAILASASAAPPASNGPAANKKPLSPRKKPAASMPRQGSLTLAEASAAESAVAAGPSSSATADQPAPVPVTAEPAATTSQEVAPEAAATVVTAMAAAVPEDTSGAPSAPADTIGTQQEQEPATVAKPPAPVLAPAWNKPRTFAEIVASAAAAASNAGATAAADGASAGGLVPARGPARSRWTSGGGNASSAVAKAARHGSEGGVTVGERSLSAGRAQPDGINRTISVLAAEALKVASTMASVNATDMPVLLVSGPTKTDVEPAPAREGTVMAAVGAALVKEPEQPPKPTSRKHSRTPSPPAELADVIGAVAGPVVVEALAVGAAVQSAVAGASWADEVEAEEQQAPSAGAEVAEAAAAPAATATGVAPVLATPAPQPAVKSWAAIVKRHTNGGMAEDAPVSVPQPEATGVDAAVPLTRHRSHNSRSGAPSPYVSTGGAPRAPQQQMVIPASNSVGNALSPKPEQLHSPVVVEAVADEGSGGEGNISPTVVEDDGGWVEAGRRKSKNRTPERPRRSNNRGSYQAVNRGNSEGGRGGGSRQNSRPRQ